MSGTEKRGKYYRKVLGPDGYKKMVANRKLLHEKLLRRARVPLHHADMLPEFMRSSIAMPSRSQVRRGNVCHREWGVFHADLVCGCDNRHTTERLRLITHTTS